MTKQELKPYTLESYLKEKDKKFLWRFGTKKIKNEKIPVIYFNYEYKGKLTRVTSDWLRLDKSYHWNVFQKMILTSVGMGYEIVYNGKEGIKLFKK
jgi:hypothetical protein